MESECEADSSGSTEQLDDIALALNGINNDNSDRAAQRVLLDSGSSRHTWYNAAAVVDQRRIAPIKLTCATGKPINIHTVGTVNINGNVRIKDVAVMPMANANLMSVARVCNAGFKVVFDSQKADIIDNKGKISMTFLKENNVYVYYRNKGKLPKASDGYNPNATSTKETDKRSGSQPALAPNRTRKRDTSARQSSSTQPVSKPKSTSSRSQSDSAAYIGEEDDSGNDSESCFNLEENSHDQQQNQLSGKDMDDALRHRRFGHQSIYPSAKCETCMVTRLRRTGVSKQPYTDTDVPLHTLVADLIGPISTRIEGQKIRTPSIGGNLYVLNVMCAATRHVWTKTLKAKSDTAAAVISLLRKLMNRYSPYKLVRFHSDGGTEFVNAELGDYLDTNGIEHTYTTTNHPQHNGKIERVNQTLLKLARSMLTECAAPIQLWGDAITYASYVYNHTPLKVIGLVAPIQMLTGQQPDLTKIRVFGCNAFYALPDKHRSKFQPTFSRGVWIGHSTKQNASRILTDHGRIVVTRDVRLDEDSFSHMSELVRGYSSTSGITG
jgi:hypothetical protein